MANDSIKRINPEAISQYRFFQPRRKVEEEYSLSPVTIVSRYCQNSYMFNQLQTRSFKDMQFEYMEECRRLCIKNKVIF